MRPVPARGYCHSFKSPAPVDGASLLLRRRRRLGHVLREALIAVAVLWRGQRRAALLQCLRLLRAALHPLRARVGGRTAGAGAALAVGGVRRGGLGLAALLQLGQVLEELLVL